MLEAQILTVLFPFNFYTSKAMNPIKLFFLPGPKPPSFSMISIIYNNKTTSFSISPNPIQNQTASFKVSGKAKNELLTLNIIDLQSKLVEQNYFHTDDYGNVDTELQLKKQRQKGTYIFELVSEQSKEYLKVASR